jgi:hypothetical protein
LIVFIGFFFRSSFGNDWTFFEYYLENGNLI